MTVFKTLALAGVAWLTAGSTAFAEVQLIIRNGQVSLVAKDATVRQILNPQQPGVPIGVPGVLPFPQGGTPAADPPPVTNPPGAQPTAPFGGAAVPGMIVQPPPGQAQPGMPGQPQRPGGNP